MKCAACGAELAEGTKFCTQCGHTVEGASVVDQGAGYGQGTNYQSGAGYGQGTDYQQGAGYGQGTNYQSGAGYGQGTGYQQGAGYGQGTGYQQGAGYGQGTNYQSGAGYGQGTNYQSGAGYGQGTGYQQGAGYGQGTGFDYGQAYVNGTPGPMTKKEFYKLPRLKDCRSGILASAIICYFSAGVTLLASFLLQGYVSASVLDGLLLLGLGLWMQIGKSRVCAIILTCYGAFNMIYMLMLMGQIQGWLIPVAGISGIVYTFKFNKLWDRYIKEGMLP